jgi:hypothetical protein
MRKTDAAGGDLLAMNKIGWRPPDHHDEISTGSRKNRSMEEAS